MKKRSNPRYFIIPFNGDNLVRAYSLSNATKFFLYDTLDSIKKNTRVATPDEIADMVRRGIIPIDATGDVPTAHSHAAPVGEPATL